MLTVDDVRSIPLFSTLAAPELERLAKTSADIRLAAGDYAAHEGADERALFAVLSGKREVVKLIDGIERTLGWRPSVAFEQGLEATVRWYVDRRDWWEAILARTGELAFDWSRGARR